MEVINANAYKLMNIGIGASKMAWIRGRVLDVISCFLESMSSFNDIEIGIHSFVYHFHGIKQTCDFSVGMLADLFYGNSL